MCTETDLDFRVLLREEYETQIRMLQDGKRVLEEEAKDLKNDIWVLKDANDKLNTYWESEVKVYEDERKILVNKSQELQKELEAIKPSVPEENLQLDCSSSEPQQAYYPNI